MKLHMNLNKMILKNKKAPPVREVPLSNQTISYRRRRSAAKPIASTPAIAANAEGSGTAVPVIAKLSYLAPLRVVN
jgi:hypothetical protein